MTVAHTFHLLVILATLVAVAVGRMPGTSMNRATMALTGAVILCLGGAIGFEEALRHVELNTISLLFALMVLNVHLRRAAFFRLVTATVVSRAHSPRQLLALTIAASGSLSALFLNDTIVLMLTPLIVDVTRSLGRRPLPYLLGLATAANIGSAATITGNPQNMLIGIASGIPYVTFLAKLAVPSLIGLFAAYSVIVLLHRDEFRDRSFAERLNVPVTIDRRLLAVSLLATIVMLGGFLSGMPMALAALMAAAILAIFGRMAPDEIMADIDWSLLVFFAGLFVVTAAITSIGASDVLFRYALPVAEAGIGPLAAVGVVLSNLVSNVPAVMLFLPMIKDFPHPESAWLTLALSSTLAGNLTLLGSVANLIVAESARRQGVQLGFVDYLKVGLPITLISTAIGVAWLILVT